MYWTRFYGRPNSMTDVAAQLLGRLDRLIGGVGDLTRKDADAEFGEQSLRLILVDVHVRASVTATRKAAL